MGEDDRDRWAEKRSQAIAAHAAADRQRRTAEIKQARQLLADFVREAAARGVRPAPLRAKRYTGRATYRTSLHGWYLNPEHTFAVGTDGEFYVLTVSGSLLGRLTGVAVEAEQPRLILGEGARDGESMPLKTLLDTRLATGNTAP